MTRSRGIFACALIFVLAFAVCFAVAGADGEAMAQPKGNDAYWSESNAPVFYGATGIKLSKNAISEFDIKDSRFRLFAKDFEDGDLESAIQCSGAQDVKPDEPETYVLHYSVRDSHGNVADKDVNVIVEDDESGMITVERTMYLIPNDWNMTGAGFSRCNGGDRQILGIYLPANAYFDMKILSSADELKEKCNITKLTVAMLNDDALRETATDVPVTPSEEAIANDGYTRVTNEYTKDDKTNGSYPGNYASVPFLSSNKLVRGEDVNSTFKFEIRFDAQSVRRLNYYHYKDFGGGDEGEAEFLRRWYATEDSHAVLENAAVTVLVPVEDMPKLHSVDQNGRPSAGFVFENIDAFLEYYEEVVERMDKIVGLSYHPEKPTDQNLRAKYLVKANAHGAGAAYYAGNHVGINSKTADERYPNGLRGQMYAFFQMNWGGLHEIAHGYQGGLGGGSMGLGEVSNNILGYYIQLDEQLYTYRGGGTWLGDIHDQKTEAARNALRLDEEAPQGLLNMEKADVAVVVKLYFLVNLFEAFEKEDTYARLFSLYREERAQGKNPTQQDFYAHFFAKEYDANVLPYFEQWGVSVSEEVAEEASKASKCYSVLADSVGDRLDEIVEEQGKSQRFGLVEDAELERYGMTGSASLSASDDESGMIAEGRTALLTKGDKTVAQATISGGKASFENVPVGSYTLRLPTISGFRSGTAIATIENGGRAELTFEYTPFDADFYPTQIYVAGIRQTLGWSIDILSSKQGQIKNGAADLGNMGNEWNDRTDEIYMSVGVLDENGREVWRKDVKGKEYFDYKNPDVSVPLGIGYRIFVSTPKPQLVYVCSLANGKDGNNKGKSVIEGYSSGLSNVSAYLEFEITKTGILPKYKENFDISSEMFGAVKELCEQNLSELKEYFEQNPDSLSKKYLDRSKKDEFASWYNKMSDEARAPYEELYEKMQKGGAPEATLKAASATFKNMSEIDWSELVEVEDAEDGKLTLGDGNFTIKCGDLSKKGEYQVEAYATDSDGNKTAVFTFTVRILEDDATKDGLSALGIGLICAAVAAVLIATALVAIFALKGKKKEKAAR